MAPLRFEEWALHSYASTLERDRRRAQIGEASEKYQEKLGPLKKLEEEISAEIEPLQKALLELRTRCAGIENELREARTTLAGARGKLDGQNKQKEKLDDAGRVERTAEQVELLLRVQDNFRLTAAELESLIGQCEVRIGRLEGEQAEGKTEMARLSAAVEAREASLKEARVEIEGLRREYAKRLRAEDSPKAAAAAAA